MVCKLCGEEFELQPDHKGLANVCLGCGGEDVERLMAEVSWEGKQTPLVRVNNAKQAKNFNSLLRRHGAGVLKSIVTTRETRVGIESGKSGSGTELGAEYTSPLREKHNLKR